MGLTTVQRDCAACDENLIFLFQRDIHINFVFFTLIVIRNSVFAITDAGTPLQSALTV